MKFLRTAPKPAPEPEDEMRLTCPKSIYLIIMGWPARRLRMNDCDILMMNVSQLT